MPLVDPREVPEPGAELDARLTRIEQRVREQLGAFGEAEPADAVVRVSARDVLVLIACIRELLRDREALLEDIEALECSAGQPDER